MKKEDSKRCGGCGRSHPPGVVCNKLECAWCGETFFQEDMQATIKAPNRYFCRKCYQEGLDIENEAMYGETR